MFTNKSISHGYIILFVEIIMLLSFSYVTYKNDITGEEDLNKSKVIRPESLYKYSSWYKNPSNLIYPCIIFE